MADLSNLKISETYGRVLQKDPDTGVLQDLTGTVPPSITFDRTTLKYIDGNEQTNYVLTSDAAGNASWAAAGGGGDTYWSAATSSLPVEYIRISGNTTSAQIGGDLDISGNTQVSGVLSADTLTGRTLTLKENLGVSGDTFLGNGLGVSGNTDVKGFLSADTGVYSYNLYTSNITTTASSTDTLQIQSDKLQFKSHGGSVEYFQVQDDKFQFFFDGGETVAWNGPSHASPQYLFNAGGQDVDFKIAGPTSENTFQVFVGENRVRMMHHLVMGSGTNIPNSTVDNYGLAVTGSSLFYPGTTSTNCINAPGPISADTITGETIISTHGTIYSANTDLLDIFQVASATPQTSYFTADTTPSDTVKYIRASGNTTSVKIGGDVELSGDVTTTNLILAADGYIMPVASSNTIKMRAQTYDGEMISIGPDLFNVNMDSENSLNITPTKVTFNQASRPQNFEIKSDSGQFTVQSNAEFELLTIGNSGGTSIGGTTTRWPTSTGFANEYANKTLQVNGLTFIHSGGTGQQWVNDTRALVAVGGVHTSGNTFLGAGLGVSGDTEVGGTLSADTMSGRTLTLIENLGVSGATILRKEVIIGSGLGVTGDTEVRGTLSANTMSGRTLTLKENLGVTGSTRMKGHLVVGVQGIGVSGDTEVGGTLSANTMSGRTLTLKENLGVSGNTYLGNNIYLPDNGQAIFGAAGDLSIIHNSIKSIITNTTGELLFENEATDADIRFKGDDDGSTITALTLDMSEAGTAQFNAGATFAGEIKMGTSKITEVVDPTAAQDAATKNYVDNRYAYQYITFLGNVGTLSDDDWAFPGTNGISNHTWGGGVTGADGIITGSSVIELGRTIQHSFIRVPAGSKLVGLEGAVRSNTNDQAYAGLFTFLPDYEGPNAEEATLRILAQTPSSSNNVTNDPQSFKSWAAEADMYTFADGECILPALRRDSTSSQILIGSFTIILKTLITS